jgi:hypothetical protein
MLGCVMRLASFRSLEKKPSLVHYSSRRLLKIRVLFCLLGITFVIFYCTCHRYLALSLKDGQHFD